MKKNLIIILLLLIIITCNKLFAQDLTSGLVGSYLFNGNTNDVSTSQLHGVSYGAELTEDRFGVSNRAYKFNGINQYIQIPDADHFSINTTGKLSISVWMWCEVLNFPKTQSDNYLHWMGKGVTGQHEWTMRIYNKESIRPNRTSCYAFNITGGLGAGTYVQEEINAKEWIHYVAVYDFPANEISIYKNGVFRRKATFTSFEITPSNGTAPVRIGTRDFGSYFYGAIDDVRFYNRVLSSIEVEELYKENGWDGPVGLNKVSDFYNVIIRQNQTNQLIIDFNNVAFVQKIDIYDMTGRLVFTEDIQIGTHNPKEIIVSNLHNGIYLLNISENNRLYSKKLIIN